MCEIAFEYDFYENVINMNIINTNCSVVSRYAYCVSPTWGGGGGGIWWCLRMGGNTWFLVEQGGRGISRRLQSINGGL